MVRKILFNIFKIVWIRDMKWSTNISEIKQQGYLWEKKIAKKGYIQLPYGFKAFDFYRAGEAISAKTINTLSACYTKNRNLIKYVINKYVKSMINFKQYTKCGITIHNDDIIKKNYSLVFLLA